MSARRQGGLTSKKPMWATRMVWPPELGLREIESIPLGSDVVARLAVHRRSVAELELVCQGRSTVFSASGDSPCSFTP